MIRTLALLCLLAASSFGIWEKGFKVRYDWNPLTIGDTSFMEQPTTVSEATELGWVQMTKPDLPTGYDKLVLYCPSSDYTLCLLFDDTDYIAGLQIAFDSDNFVGAVFDWTVSGFVSWPVTVDGTTVNYKATHQFYISAATLATDSADRLAARDDDYILQDGNLLLRGFNGDLYSVPTDTNELKTNSVYTQQACILGMGNHYYYNMTTDLTCGADTIFTWFPLEYNDQLIGVGFLIPGKPTIDSDKLYPFEDPDSAAIEMIVPTGPSCLWAYGDTPGVTTMHTYFIKDGYLMTCVW